MEAGLPGHNAGLAPGMSQVITAGESYTIKDDNGVELELVGKDDPAVIEFLEAFDAWQTIIATLGHSSDAAVTQYGRVQELWRGLPHRIMEMMPSHRAGGVVVPGRTDSRI